MSKDINELQTQFQAVQDALKDAAQGIQELLGGEGVPPPAGQARYEATTKIEEAYMWAANGVQSLIQLDAKVQEAAEAMAPEVAKTGKSSLKVVK